MSEDHGPLAGRHVLLVEDDYFIAFDMQRHFETSGAHVLGPAPSVREALALISGAARIDAAVLDINLRGEMAFAVADELAARGVPFLFATGYNETSIPSRYAAQRRCEKPVEPEQIARLLFA
ncbi:response regulator [Methylobacterium oxalidis]|uniref:response regulator n=1 Tax=Methylobacterium oxalidis TaxID=944322 RepID=UPI00331524B0